jgi:hypothetical protein
MFAALCAIADLFRARQRVVSHQLTAATCAEIAGKLGFIGPLASAVKSVAPLLLAEPAPAPADASSEPAPLADEAEAEAIPMSAAAAIFAADANSALDDTEDGLASSSIGRPLRSADA